MYFIFLAFMDLLSTKTKVRQINDTMKEGFRNLKQQLRGVKKVMARISEGLPGETSEEDDVFE